MPLARSIVAALTLISLAPAQGYDPKNYKDLEWTNVGPNRGGRSVACTGVRTRPREYYFGATGGGLWKTDDAGTTWSCVTDGFLKSSSVGAVAVSDSNSDVVYIGMGERDIRGDISEGDGIYKSTDAGKTWTHIGLEETRTISRIVVDPKNPDVVYVAALGHVYGPNRERGVYKSADGGKTWDQILFESPRAGAVDLVMDPHDPKTLYAATWEAWRTPSFLNSGGPGSKLFKTIDAGRNWTEITRNAGLPKGLIGKIGITVSGADSKRLYACVEAADGGIYRSDDAGATWTKVNESSNYRQRAWYFSHIFADPKTVDKVFCLNVGAGRSGDGGKTFGGFSTSHSDNHDLWINPDDPTKMIEANDGGASVSQNGGDGWSRESYPTAEIYHVTADIHIPYRIYGAQQDNSAVRLMPDQSDSPTRRNFDNTAGGESGYITPNRADPEVVYGGNYSGVIDEMNYRTNVRRRLDPWPLNPMGHAAADLVHRIQWTYPIVTSPHDPKAIYSASQFVLLTDDDGLNWRQISPDLTRNDPAKQVSSGGPLTQDNTSIEYYDTVFTVAESPVARGLIWAGSDDGLVHITRDGGGHWTDVTPPGMPHWGRVSMVDPSQLDAATAYLAVNDYQNGDLKPYIYRTHDFGRTWTKIVNGIPEGAFARVCRIDPNRPGLLYAGTETGAFVSFNDGDSWQSLNLNLPVCPVHDLLRKDDDLIAATHGRSFWIMHHVSRLAELTAGPVKQPILYPPIDRPKLGGRAQANFDYYIPAAAKKVDFEIFDRRGQRVGSSTGQGFPGFHSESVSLFHPGFGSFPGMVMWSGFSTPIPVPPGVYSVKMTVDGVTTTQPLRLTRDPRITASDRDLVEQYDFAVTVSERTNEANETVMRIRDTKAQIDKALASAPSSLKEKGQALEDRFTAIEGEIYQFRSKSSEDPLNYPIKLNDQLAGLVDFVVSNQSRPARQAHDVFNILTKQLQLQLDRLKQLESQALSQFNDLLRQSNLSVITPKTPALSTATRRRGGGDGEGGD